MNSPPLCCPLFIYLLDFFSLLSNGLTSVFFALWPRWHCFSGTDPLFQMFTVIVFGYLQQAHWSMHFFCSWKKQQQTNKRPNEWQPNLGRQRLADESNHLSSTAHLSLSASLTLVPDYLFTLSLSFHVAATICSICVFWLRLNICMYVRFVIVSALTS